MSEELLVEPRRRPLSVTAVSESIAFNGKRLRLLAERLYEMPDSAGRIKSMEGLRGAAVALTFFVHYFTLASVCLTPASWGYRVGHFLGEIGHSGVDLFFLLSGYLIYA